MLKLISSSCVVMLKPVSNPPAFQRAHSYQKNTIKTETLKSLWRVCPTLTSVVSQHRAAVWHRGLCGVDKRSYPIQSKMIWVWKVSVFLLGCMYSIDCIGCLTLASEKAFHVRGWASLDKKNIRVLEHPEISNSLLSGALKVSISLRVHPLNLQ